MTHEKTIKGLTLKVSPLGENDRLLTLISNEQGLVRLAVPGARRPNSSLAGAIPLTLLELHIGGRSNLKRVRQIKTLKSFTNVGKYFETLAGAQALTELTQMLVAVNEPIPGLLTTLLIHLERLEDLTKANTFQSLNALAICIQSILHLLALGGYGLPIQKCCVSGIDLNPPLGKWDWRCSLICDEGFAIGPIASAKIQLNPSELALLQRLLRPELPKCSTGDLMGPLKVWLLLLQVVEVWIETHLSKRITSLSMMREVFLVND